MPTLALRLLLLAATLCGAAEVIDKVAVIVGRKAITARQILEEVRYASFLNGEQPSFRLAARKEAASRLIDQELILDEIRAGSYPETEPRRAAQMLAELKKRYPTEAAFGQALATHGVDATELMRRLEWQAAVLAFVARRFATAQGAEAPAGDEINESFFSWLDTMRKETRIVYRDEELK